MFGLCFSCHIEPIGPYIQLRYLEDLVLGILYNIGFLLSFIRLLCSDRLNQLGQEQIVIPLSLSIYTLNSGSDLNHEHDIENTACTAHNPLSLD